MIKNLIKLPYVVFLLKDYLELFQEEDVHT